MFYRWVCRGRTSATALLSDRWAGQADSSCSTRCVAVSSSMRLDRREFAHETVEGCLIDLPLAVGLLRLAAVAEQVAHDFRDRSRISRGDFRLVFLRPPAPHRALRPRAAAQFGERGIHFLLTRELAKTGAFRLPQRNAQRHPVLVEGHDEDAQRMAGDLLRLDGGDLAYPMAGIDHQIARREWHIFGRHVRLSHQPNPTSAVRTPSSSRRTGGATGIRRGAESGTKGKTPRALARAYITTGSARASRSAMLNREARLQDRFPA